MRILDVSTISDSKQFFPKQGTLQFLQDAYKDQLNNICLSLLGSLGYSPAVAYVLFGCVNSGSGSNFAISAGAVFYNGEVFSVDSVNLSASGNVPLANIVTTQYTTNADPVTFSDGSTSNIHNIRKVAIGLGTSGSGISDYSAFVYVSLVTPSQVLLKGSTTAFTPTLATDPATKGYVDASSVIIAKGYTHIGAIPSSIQSYTIALGMTLNTALYKVIGTIVNNNSNNAEVMWYIDNTSQTTASFKIYIHGIVSTNMDIYFDWFIMAR